MARRGTKVYRFFARLPICNKHVHIRAHRVSRKENANLETFKNKGMNYCNRNLVPYR